MSYEVLARRFRPKTFDEIEGQRHVVTALRNALRLGRVPHALLLAGPRGVAKTTLARILARALNCDQGPTETPCGTCSPCLEIASGTSLDVQEIDAASNTGVDNVREIRESVRYAAAPGKHRIFIIDEVHMLSAAAFNALLKTLEEPPPRSLFIFATTDPQRIPITVLSRVQRFDLRRLGNAELLTLLRKICGADGIEAPESVLRIVAREAEGSARDALTLLDRLTSALGKTIAEKDAIEILDLIDRKLLVDVLDPVLARDPAGALVALRRVLEQGVDPARLAGDLLAELRDLVVARLVDDPTGMIDAAPDALAELSARARPHDAETLQRLFRVLVPSLVLLDLNMPVMDGHEFIRRVRQHPVFHPIPIVVLTTSTDKTVLRKAYNEGANAVISKVDSLEGMSAIVNTIAEFWFHTGSAVQPLKRIMWRQAAIASRSARGRCAAALGFSIAEKIRSRRDRKVGVANGLTMNPAVPRRAARTMASRFAMVDVTRIGTVLPAVVARRLRTVSSPLKSGMIQSTMIRSGFAVVASCTPEKPSPDSTTREKPSCSSMARNRRREKALSSMINADLPA